jgi:hypothetical protein
MKVAFLITVYKNDKIDFFKQAIKSIVNQDYGFDNINIYLGIDGDLTYDKDRYIQNNNKYFYKILKNNNNQGLAVTLNKLINSLEEEEYIFRMDSDDICKIDRVKSQVDFMNKKSFLDICGSNIEIIDNLSNLTNKIIKYPNTHDECFDFFKKRDPLAHPSVCFRKSYFEKAGYYPIVKKNQDTLFWAEGFLNNCKFGNLNKVGLQFRQSDDFFKRRGNINNLYVLLKNRFKINYKLKFGLMSYIYAISYFILQLMPSVIKTFIYKRLRN